MNIGIDQARNTWISVMDADDISYPTAIERVLDAAAESPEVICWGVHAVRFDATGKSPDAGKVVRHGYSYVAGFDAAMARGELPFMHSGTR